MPIECIPSNLESDIRCAVCGQGFLLFCTRVTQHQRAEMRLLVQNAMRDHHREIASGNDPHIGFMVELTAESLIALPAYVE